MAFELLFFKNKQQAIKLDDVVLYFTKQPYFSVKPLDNDYYQFLYYNPNTYVHFTFIYNEHILLNENFTYDENLEYCCLYCTIDYLKPTYFAYEAMNVVYSFLEQFPLLLLNNQDITLGIKSFSKEEIINSYIENNEKAIKEFNEQYPLPIIEKEKTDYFYYYNICEKFETNYQELSIPEINFLKLNNDDKIITVFTFEFSPYLIPKTDYVIIPKKTKGFLGLKKQQLSILPFNEVFNTFKDYFKPLNIDGLELYVFTDINDLTEKIYTDLPLIPLDDYEVMDVDELVNISL